MTDTEKRIFIAEACGWKRHELRGISCSSGAVFECQNCDSSFCSPPWTAEKMAQEWCGNKGPIPDYLNDLNACHEMEKVLTAEQEEDYVMRLDAQLQCEIYEDAPRYLNSKLCAGDLLYRATARQRADAFIETLKA